MVPNLGMLLGPAGGLAFPWLSNKFFLDCIPEGELCPATLKGLLLVAASSVGLLPVLNFAMRDFTSVFPSMFIGKSRCALHSVTLQML